MTDERCAIRGCGSVAQWIAVDHHERIDLCTRHRDLIEDAGLRLIEEDEDDA